jgi:branched-chain amino acid transport system permease protein
MIPAGRRSPWVVVLLVFALAAPFLVSGYHVFQLTQIIVYAIAVLGLNLLTGFSGQISLGNGAFYAIGGYVAVILMTNFGLPYWVTPPIAGAVCYGVGYLFGRSATRLEGLYLALATFALATATPQILKLDALERWTGGNQGIVVSKPTSPLAGQLDDDQWLYLFCLAVAIVLFVVAWNVVRGRTGRALVALRDHPVAAATMGIDVAAYKSVAFGVSAMYTGVAGALAVLTTGFVSPDSFTILVSIQFLVAGVVGGIASIFGSLFGAAFIELVPDLAMKVSDAAPQLFYGVLLIGCMMVMPGGVVGLVLSLRARFARDSVRPRRTGS